MRLLCEDLLLLGGGLLGRLLRLLGGLRLGSLGLLGLLGLGLLSLGLLGGQLEASCSLLASGGSSLNLLGGDHLPQSELDAHASLSGVHLVVGNDVLEDGLAGGSLLVLQPLDGSGDHAGIGGVGGRLGSLLGLGGLGGSRHGFDVRAGSAILSPFLSFR